METRYIVCENCGEVIDMNDIEFDNPQGNDQVSIFCPKCFKEIKLTI